MVSEFWLPAVTYREFVPAGGRVTVIGEHPEEAWRLCGMPFAAMVVGETEHPESVTSVGGPKLATVI